MRWKCPECNKKQRCKELLTLGHCKKCGRKHKMSDFIIRDPCKLSDICNYSKDCDDDDWMHCAIYIHHKHLFEYNRARENDKIISD